MGGTSWVGPDTSVQTTCWGQAGGSSRCRTRRKQGGCPPRPLTLRLWAAPLHGLQVQHKQLAQRPPHHILSAKNEQLAAHQAALQSRAEPRQPRECCRSEAVHTGKPPAKQITARTCLQPCTTSQRAGLRRLAMRRHRPPTHRVAAAGPGQVIPLLCRALEGAPGARLGVQQPHRHLRQRLLGLLWSVAAQGTPASRHNE